MDKITPLERELLKSVENLVNGTKLDLTDLQSGLMTYGKGEKDSDNERLRLVENRLTTIEKTLTEVLNPLIQRLESYQAQTEQLNRLLKRLNR